MKRRYSWVPDVPDYRDFRYVPTTAALPAHVDNAAHCSPIEDQGDLGSCTAQATVGAIEYLEKRVAGKYHNASRLFLYYETRKRQGSVDWDSGASLRDTVKAAAKVGVCRENLCPYATERFAEAPSAAAYTNAAGHRISEYRRIANLEGVRSSLAQGFPVVFGFSVYESFEGPDVERTGLVPMPAKGETMLGGHAVVAVGYDDATARLKCRNSWGRAWGKAGYFFLPYAFVRDRDLSDDYWMIAK